MEREGASHAAVRADGIGLSLSALVPLAFLAEIIFALEHQSAGGANANAITAVHTGRVRQGDIGFGRDPGIKPTAGDGNCERVLSVCATGFHTFVAENTFTIVTHIEIVINLYGLRDGFHV